MSIAKKCDICKGLYDPYRVKYTLKNGEQKLNEIAYINGIAYVNIEKYSNRYVMHDLMDCCPECMSKISTFIDSLSKKDNVDSGNEE